ncbi:hypothetical protein D9M70_611470 [compost metagenome]
MYSLPVWIMLPVSVRPATHGVSHSAPRLTDSLGTPTGRLPTVARLPVRVNSASRKVTPPSRRSPRSGSPATLNSSPRLRCSLSTPYTPLVSWPLGLVISKALSVSMALSRSSFTPTSFCLAL